MAVLAGGAPRRAAARARALRSQCGRGGRAVAHTGGELPDVVTLAVVTVSLTLTLTLILTLALTLVLALTLAPTTALILLYQ